MARWFLLSKSFVMVGMSFLISCGDQNNTGVDLKREWDRENAPERMGLISNEYQVNFDSLPKRGHLSKTPWSGGYWPTFQGGITYRWNHKSNNDRERIYYDLLGDDQLSEEQIKQLSPSEKWDLLQGDQSFSLTMKERERTEVMSRLDGKEIPRWFGLCHAWAPATIMYDEPQPVTMVREDGLRIPFGASDIKALLVYYLNGNQSRTYFASRRCNIDEAKLQKQLDSKEISIEEYQMLMDSAECRGINAGAFHIILSNLIALKDEGFVADMTRDLEVWNQAVHGYKTRILTARTSGFSPQAAPGTTREVKVETVMSYTVEIPYSWVARHRNTSKMTIRYVYWLELNEHGQIIGGSWESFDRPDFLWSRSKPAFAGEFKDLEQIYVLSTGGTIANEDEEKTIDSIKWSISNWVLFRSLKVSGKVSQDVKTITMQAKDRTGKILNSKNIKIKGDGQFTGRFRILSRDATVISLVTMSDKGKVLAVRVRKI